jgi:hypothetical protein
MESKTQMMDFKTWKNMILEVAAQIADHEYQRRSWFGEGEHVSSPDELYCGFFDDAMIEEFLASHSPAVTDVQRRAATNLINLMNQFASIAPEVLDPTEVIDDPRWEQIRHAAGLFVGAMNEAP